MYNESPIYFVMVRASRELLLGSILMLKAGANTGIYTHIGVLFLYILVSPIYCVRIFVIYLNVRVSVTYVVISYIRGDCACE